MHKKTIILLSFIFITINLCAQKSNLIVGNWVFTKPLNKGIDEAGLAFLEAEVIGKWKINFKPDGKFDTTMMGEQTDGTWNFDSNSNSITISGKEGEPQKFKILKSTKSELILKLGLGEFLLTKIE
ncbi:lipocalin family protein [Aquimarina sp. 433]